MGARSSAQPAVHSLTEPASLPVMVFTVQDLFTRVTDFKLVCESVSKIVFASFYEFDVLVFTFSVSWFYN